jgi:hypothetical protein
MKKILLALALTFGIFTATAKADPYCTQYLYDPPFNACIAWSMPPGGYACTTSTPAAHEVFIYSQTNYGGVCAALPHNSYIPDLGPSGWKNSIRSMKHGVNESSHECFGANFVAPCADWGANISHWNFPNTSGPSNWGSIQTG